MSPWLLPGLVVLFAIDAIVALATLLYVALT